MASPSPCSARIPRESFATAVEALLKWVRAQPKHQKSQLFEPDDMLYLILTLTRIPSKGRTNPYRIPIPHPLHPFDPQSTSICLILDDRPSSPLLPSAALDQIRARDLPISSVIGLSELGSDYRPYESRRKLCDSYDLFFADRKILPLLPRLLGKHFFKRKKIPLAVDSSRVGWAEQIKSWCESSLFYLRTGTCAGLKIGRVTQSKDEIVENAVAAIERAMEFVPKKWGNLRSVHVKTVESMALPVYQAVPEIGMKIEGVWEEKDGSFAKGKKRERVEEGEKKGKKEKKGRIHDAGVLDGEGGDGEVVAGEELGEEGDVLVVNVDNKISLNGNEEEEANVEEEKGMNKKKKGKKGLKAKNVKGSGDEEHEREQDAGGDLSEKRSKKKKKKMVEASVIVADGVKKSKLKKKKGEHDVILNDEEAEEVNAESGMKKKRKVKQGEKADKGKTTEVEGVGEENRNGELSEKKAKKKVGKNAAAASDEMKMGKTKKQRVNM